MPRASLTLLLMIDLFFPPFSLMIFCPGCFPYPGALVPLVVNHRFLRWISRLTSDPPGRLFAVVLVSPCFVLFVLSCCLITGFSVSVFLVLHVVVLGASLFYVCKGQGSIPR